MGDFEDEVKAINVETHLDISFIDANVSKLQRSSKILSCNRPMSALDERPWIGRRGFHEHINELRTCSIFGRGSIAATDNVRHVRDPPLPDVFGRR